MEIQRKIRHEVGSSSFLKANNTDGIKQQPGKLVLIEPKPPDFHIFSKTTLPRLGTVFLGLIMPWLKKFYEDGVRAPRALLKPGAQVRGLLGPGTQDKYVPEGVHSPLGQSEDHETEINRFRR